MLYAYTETYLMIIYYLYTNIQLARCSARPKHPHEPLVAYELQRPSTFLAVIMLWKTVHLNKQQCITICHGRALESLPTTLTNSKKIICTKEITKLEARAWAPLALMYFPHEAAVVMGCRIQ
jgi:hypothetical protein